MSFKDDVKSDIADVFFDPGEFAEMHIVNGKEMLISIDEAELTRRAKETNRSSYEEGIHKKELLFFVTAKDFGRLPKINSYLTIDNGRFLVANTKAESGVYAITLLGGHR